MAGVPEIHPKLREAYQKSELVLFVGSGLSLGKDVKGDFPTWKEVGPRLLAFARKNGWIDEQEEKVRLEVLETAVTLNQLLADLDSVKAKLEEKHYYDALQWIFLPGELHHGAAGRVRLSPALRLHGR